MRSDRRARPQLLALEGRALLSGASHALAHVHRPEVVLNGWSSDLVVVDRAGFAHVTGKGHLSGLGKVTITSTVDTKGETAILDTNPANLYADLVVSSPKGQVDVRVMPGTLGMNPFAQPVHMQYFVYNGTGPYHHATGKGLVDLTLGQPIPSTLSGLKALGTQVDTRGVPFTLHFHPGKLNKVGDLSSMWFGMVSGLEHKSSSPPAARSHASAKKG